MIYSVDDFIDKDLFKIATDYLSKGNFLKHTVGEKDFYVQESPESFNKYVLGKLGMIEGKPLENILSFFRVSTDVLDSTWRIHSDLNIKGERPDRAAVIYMSPREELDMWRLVSVSGYDQNRLLSYPANYFHSKYPNKSWKEGRQVYVIFYKFKN